MKLSNEKSGLLKSFLGTLPEQAVSKLAQAVEVDRLMDGQALPHEAILTGLRRYLHTASRTLTPLRLFSRPFEDLLESGPRQPKQKGVIARGSVVPVWNWLSTVLLPDQAQSYFQTAKAQILAGKLLEAQITARQFGRQAGQAMREALSTGPGLAAAKRKLKPDEIADAGEMALLLIESEEIAKIQDRVPKPLPHLSEEILWQLRESYDALIARNPDVAPFVAVVAMNRLKRPCEALRLPLMICRQTGDALISRTDMGLVGEILFARMDAFKAQIMAVRHPAFEVETLLAAVQGFAELSSAVVKEIEMRRDGEWGQRLLKDRAAVGQVMDGLMDRSIKEFAAVLPMQKGTADFSRPANAERRALALDYSRLVAGTRDSAAAACFAAKQKRAAEELCNHLRRYIDDAVREIRASGGEKRATIESQLQYCAELAAILFSEEDADLIRRRARAAQAAA